jgi:hypothetical protein
MTVAVDFSRYANILPEEHQEPLSRNLRRIPDFSWLLGAPHPSAERLQGDLILDVPTVFLDQTAVPRTHNFTVMVLNNTCDLPDDRLEVVTVVPVVDFAEFLTSQRNEGRSDASLHGYAEAIRRNDITELFYLPPFGSFLGGGLGLLQFACSISQSVYLKAVNEGRRAASFSQIGFYFFLIKLTTHIARPETPEVIRLSASG